MYKVFFNNRTVFLADKYKTNFYKFDGLFYKYQNKPELKKFWDFFEIISGINQLFIVHPDVESLKKEFFGFFHFLQAAGGLVFNSKGQLLIIRRFGKWDLPKGKVEPGEKIEDTAIREVEEECGLTGLTITRKLPPTYHTYSLNNEQMMKETHWFEMRYEGNERLVPQLEEDITEVKWAGKNEIGFVFENTYKSIIDVLADGGISRP